MTASVHFITPRKPKRLVTPSDRLSKRELITKLRRAIEKKRGTKEGLEKALGVKLTDFVSAKNRIVKLDCTFHAKKEKP